MDDEIIDIEKEKDRLNKKGKMMEWMHYILFVVGMAILLFLGEYFLSSEGKKIVAWTGLLGFLILVGFWSMRKQ